MSSLKDSVLALLEENGGFLSGQEISEKLDVSRTAVWKAINQLKEQGFEIEAVRNKGYRVLSRPDIITEKEIRKYLVAGMSGSRLIVFDSIDSTNLEAKRRAEAGEEEGLLVTSDRQISGRGRRGRGWDSPPGTGIFMSLLLRPAIQPVNASMITLVMALAVRKAINKLSGLEAVIKWPNDIVCEGKKVCGILTEMSLQEDYISHIVIGAGINVNNESFPKEIEATASSLKLLGAQNVRRSELIAEILNSFELYYDKFLETEDLRGLKEEYNSYLVNAGRQVKVIAASGDITGIAKGIDDRGELIVETGDGSVHVNSGEVSVRGIYGYV